MSRAARPGGRSGEGADAAQAAQPAYWADEIAGQVVGPQVVNDSKTPSGTVHVGSLRGVVLHDAVRRAVAETATKSSSATASRTWTPWTISRCCRATRSSGTWACR